MRGQRGRWLGYDDSTRVIFSFRRKRTSFSLGAAKFMTSLPAESIPKDAEIIMKEWAEHYSPVRQRTVRSETTKDKAGAIPPAVYEKVKTGS